MFIKNLANLIKVKTIITILTTLVFCYLSCVGTITPELFMAIFTMIIGFYFGTQSEKKAENTTTTE